MRQEQRPLPDDSEDDQLSSVNVNDLTDSHGNGGIDNVCLNIDKYLDELEKSIDTKKHTDTRRSNSNSLPSTSTDYKNWSTVSKSSIRRLSMEGEPDHKLSVDPSDTFLTFPYEDPTNNGSNIRLLWRNLTYQSLSRTSVSGRRMILSQQNGEIHGGQLTAIIGPSGAGKSTLLESLAGRRSRGLKGQVVVVYDRDYVHDPSSIKISFIGQRDQLIGLLTVRETLLFASRMKNYRKIKNRYYNPRLVDSILKALNLEQCADVRVAKISGGQLKRLTFAIELISGPDILMIDEPTSGLDSSSTYQCISLLRKLTDLRKSGNYFRPPAIMCSIHQPSARVLNIFHQIYVLSADGRCLYHGSPKSIVNHLSKHDLNCPQFHNPADFIIEIASGDYGLDPINRLAIFESNKQMGLVSEEKMYLSCKKLNLSSGSSVNKSSTDLSTEPVLADHLTERPANANQKRIKVKRVVDRMKRGSFPIFSHFWLLLIRTYMTTIRDPKLTWFRIFQAIFIGLLMSFLYDHPIGEASGCFPTINLPSNLAANSATSLPQSSTPPLVVAGSVSFNTSNSIEKAVAETQDNIAFIFFITLFTVMACMMPTVLTFPAEVAVHIQERNNGWYSCWTYYWTKIIADTPYQVAITTLFCSIVYPMTGQIWEEWRFALFILISVLVSNIAQCVGMLFGTIYVRSVPNAVFMAPLSMAPVFLLSGFFGKLSKVPIFLKPIATISYVRYAFEAFLVVIYGFDRCPPLVRPIFRSAYPISAIGGLNNSFIQSAASEGEPAIQVPPDYDEEDDQGGLLAGLSTTTSAPSFGDDQETFYDSLPKVWSGFYNPLDYLSLSPQTSFADSITSNESTSSSIILKHFDLTDDTLWQNIAILMASLTFLRIVTYIVLLIKTNERR